MLSIPFNKPYMTGNELANITQVHAAGYLSGDGMFTKRCAEWLEQRKGCKKALLTHSCTAAHEMATMLANLGLGENINKVIEVISHTLAGGKLQ